MNSTTPLARSVRDGLRDIMIVRMRITAPRSNYGGLRSHVYIISTFSKLNNY